MKTPIFDFLSKYAKDERLRLHMPGHKGLGLLGVENLDITEIDGADSLFHPNGIIKESEKNASEIFGANTYFSTEGSSLCIRTMVYLLVDYAVRTGTNPLILAGRNAHKSFINACALSGATVEWLFPENSDCYLGCSLNAEQVEKAIVGASQKPIAVYITTPDYLGNILDVEKIAKVCKKYGILLAVDNAHGGYLKFLEKSLHPIDLGADMCCDSAHKTLSALTGSAYLHLSKEFNAGVSVKSVMSLFGSTSPSYLTLASLDLLNKELAEDFSTRLTAFCKGVECVKQGLLDIGYRLLGDEPLKITIDCKSHGYRGVEFAQILRKKGVECEFCDPDFVVLMLSVNTGKEGLLKLAKTLFSIPEREKIDEKPPVIKRAEKVMEIRQAVLSKKKVVDLSSAVGKVLALDSVGCPPAVPIVVSGERIDDHALECFRYYGVNKVTIVD